MRTIECSFYFAYNVSTDFDMRTMESSLFCTQCIDCFDMPSTASTYIGFGGMVGKPWFSAFQNFFRIENPLNIKKVMGRNMCIDCIDIT